MTGANTVAVNTGGALVDGKWFINDASQDVNIPSASGGGNTRIDRIVLRADWAGFNVSVYRIAGVDAADPSAPAITQTSGTTYDITLYQARVTTDGTVTLSDERTWASVSTDGIADDSIDSEHYIDGSIDTAHIGDSQVTAAKIANRTRTFLVQPIIDSAAYHPGGVIFADAELKSALGYFIVPSDFASGLTVSPVLIPAANGDAYLYGDCYYAADGEAYTTHRDEHAYAAYTLVNQTIEDDAFSFTLSSAAIGDYVYLIVSRNGAHASDTINNSVYCRGFLVSYTADS